MNDPTRKWILFVVISLALVTGCQTETDSLPEPISTLIDPIPSITPPGLQEDPMPPTHANADVIYVKVIQESEENSWTFHVTVLHPDTGWEDYADGWDVVLPDGTVVKPDPNSPFTRLLLHPHQEEQPFTRSQSGIMIPDEITSVLVRAHDLVDGFGGEEVEVDLTADAGINFEVAR